MICLVQFSFILWIPLNFSFLIFRTRWFKNLYFVIIQKEKCITVGWSYIHFQRLMIKNSLSSSAFVMDNVKIYFCAIFAQHYIRVKRIMMGPTSHHCFCMIVRTRLQELITYKTFIIICISPISIITIIICIA